MKGITRALFSRPWAVQHHFLKSISDLVEQRFEDYETGSNAFRGSGIQHRGRNRIVDGVAFIPIHGIISKRLNLLHEILGTGISVVEITEAFKSAIKNDAVKKIVLDIDSPGGSVDGLVELSDLIYVSRKKKPIIAYTDGQMVSAAYWIGSAAHKVYATRGAEVGSIGVYSVTRDYSVMEHNMGVQTHVVRSSKYKPLAHPSTPLTADERNEIQSEVDIYFQFFVDAIARNRNIPTEGVLALADGRSHIGDKAKELGLIDGLKMAKSLTTSDSEDLSVVATKPLLVQSAADLRAMYPKRFFAQLSDIRILYK